MMSWKLCGFCICYTLLLQQWSGRGLIENTKLLADAVDETHSEKPDDESGTPKETMVKASDINREMLLRFKVPAKSIATDESPFRIEAEVLRAKKRGPFVLHGYALLPMSRTNVRPEAQEEESPSEKQNDTGKPRDTENGCQRYLKLRLGRMDVVAPLQVGQELLLFPYEDAIPLRKRLKAGDVILVGVEAIPLAGDVEVTQAEVSIKTLSLISW